jgi:pimeloyl-ACP methyl ester carboxylesterase
MALPGLVLVHGGGHAGDCWDLTVDEIRRLEPNLRVLAVDLPGRRNTPGDLRTSTIAEWTESLVRDIDAAAFSDVVVVGHSLAGITVPPAVAALGAQRVAEVVLISAIVPPVGAAVIDTTPGPLGWLARKRGGAGTPGPTPAWVVRFIYCNGMPSEKRRLVQSQLCWESSRIISETVGRHAIPDGIPRTWIMAKRDRAMPVKTQRRSIAALGGVDTVIPVDTCHNIMFSEPELLAQILVERCRRYS